MTSREIPDIKDWTILVIDDAYDSAYMVSQIMAFYGAKVQIANDGPQALKLMKWFKPTMILLDLQMPDMDGYEVKDTIHKIFPHAPFPIIAHTATVNPAEAPLLLKEGFDGYVLKPLDIDRIPLMLKKILQHKWFGQDN